MDNFGDLKLNNNLPLEAHRKEQAPTKNIMLGEIDEKTGKYVVAEDISAALVGIIKSIDKKVEDNYFVNSFSDFDEFGKLQFVIATEIIEENKRKATLYLIEKIETNGGLTVEANIHTVSEFIDANDVAFEFKMLKNFNVINTALVRPEDIEDEFEEYILYKKFLAKEVKTVIKDKMEVVEAELLTKRLKLLLEYGEFGLDALTVYETLQKKAKEKFKRDKLTAQELNELLEAALSYAQKKHREEAERFFAAQKIFIEDYTKKAKEVEKAAIKQVKASGAASKRAAAAARKGGGAKKGGAGGGGKGGGGGGGAKKAAAKPVATVEAPKPSVVVIDKMTFGRTARTTANPINILTESLGYDDLIEATKHALDEFRGGVTSTTGKNYDSEIKGSKEALEKDQGNKKAAEFSGPSGSI